MWKNLWTSQEGKKLHPKSPRLEPSRYRVYKVYPSRKDILGLPIINYLGQIVCMRAYADYILGLYGPRSGLMEQKKPYFTFIKIPMASSTKKKPKPILPGDPRYSKRSSR